MIALRFKFDKADSAPSVMVVFWIERGIQRDRFPRNGEQYSCISLPKANNIHRASRILQHILEAYLSTIGQQHRVRVLEFELTVIPHKRRHSHIRTAHQEADAYEESKANHWTYLNQYKKPSILQLKRF